MARIQPQKSIASLKVIGQTSHTFTSENDGSVASSPSSAQPDRTRRGATPPPHRDDGSGACVDMREVKVRGCSSGRGDRLSSGRRDEIIDLAKVNLFR